MTIENPIKRNGRNIHANMVGENIPAKNAKAVVFVSMAGENMAAKNAEATVFVNMADKKHVAKTVETKRRHAPMASKNHAAKTVEARRFANMVGIDISVKNVEVLHIVATAHKKTYAENAKGVRFASMANKGINAKSVVPASVNMVRSNLGASSAKNSHKA